MTAEQRARDLLERCGVEDAQSFTAGDVVELANLLAEAEEDVGIIQALRRQRDSAEAKLAAIRDRCENFTPDPSVVDEIIAILDAEESA